MEESKDSGKSRFGGNDPPVRPTRDPTQGEGWGSGVGGEEWTTSVCDSRAHKDTDRTELRRERLWGGLYGPKGVGDRNKVPSGRGASVGTIVGVKGDDFGGRVSVCNGTSTGEGTNETKI